MTSCACSARGVVWVLGMEVLGPLRHGVLLALSALILGCTPMRSESEARVASGLELGDYLARSSEAVCDAHVRCCDRWITSVGSDTELCHPAFISRAEQRMSRAVAQQRARFDPDRAASALTRLETPDCDALGTFGHVSLTDVRDEAFVGQGALGDACIESFECRSARCREGHCVAPQPPPPGERLVADVGEGEVCGERRCGEWLRCVGGGDTPARCVRALGSGQLCDASGRCPHGFTCSDESCTAMPTVGTPCDPRTSPCLEGLCEEGRCRPGREGESCSENEELAFLEPDSQACADGLHCDLARLRCIREIPSSGS